MSKKMSVAYKALKLSDAVDAAIDRFQIIVIAIGAIMCAGMYLELINPIAVMVSFLVLSVVALAMSIMGVGSIITMKALGFSEVELEHMGLA